MYGIDRREVQGLVASGYAKQPALCSVLLAVEDPSEASRWLRETLPALSFSDDKSGTVRRNLAFTHRGLQRLDLEPGQLDQFSREFTEGMVAPHRQRVLGDRSGGPSDPAGWTWGGPNNPPIDALMMLYAPDPPALARELESLREGLRGLSVVDELPATALADNKEHFGFRDGIAQPTLAGFGRSGTAENTIATGEVLLGHVDQTADYEPAPPCARNGSYLVFRQLQQDVEGFWNYLRREVASGDDRPDELVHWASKIIGRWPDGTPLTLSPRPPVEAQPTNDFGYAQADRSGTRCPLGAHIRRANPRDGLLRRPERSIDSVNRHRILRRGRAYGPPADPAVFPRGLTVESAEGFEAQGAERGIFFICLNASISRQFEFIQQTWLNNPKFHGLSSEIDSVGSSIDRIALGEDSVFTAPGHPLRRRLRQTPSFVRTVGGTYFFLPSRALLEHLARDRSNA